MQFILYVILSVDVAISAPFGGTNEPGTVYIYAGTGSNLLSQNPVQVNSKYVVSILVIICLLLF